jgi:outer membrane protein assembly factor BamB
MTARWSPLIGDRATCCARDATTGELLWDYQRQTPEFFTIKGGGEPLVVDNRVYAGFADGHLVALHADSGDEIWAAYLGDESGEFGDVGLPIVIDDERLVASSHSGGVYLVERATGALMWRADVTEVTGAEFIGGWLFLSTAGGRVVALDTRDGDIGWEYNTPDDRPAMDLRLVYPYVAVATVDGPMIWLRLRDGQAISKWAPSTGFQSAPVFDERYGYVISNQGYLYGFRLAF